MSTRQSKPQNGSESVPKPANPFDGADGVARVFKKRAAYPLSGYAANEHAGRARSHAGEPEGMPPESKNWFREGAETGLRDKDMHKNKVS
jgi:hypothetical protein